MSTMSTRHGAPGQARLAARHETMQAIFGYVYTALVVNVSLVVANLPLAMAVAAVPGLFRAWPFFLAISLTITPSLAGAFGAFRDLRDRDAPRPVSAFWASWRRNLLRASVLGFVATFVIGSALFDLALVRSNPLAPLAAPTLVVVACGGVAVMVMALAGFVTLEGRPVSAWAIVKASIYLAVRRWYFSLMALALLGLTGAAILAQPVWGTFLVPGILLFGVWSNGHYAFTRLTQQLATS